MHTANLTTNLVKWVIDIEVMFINFPWAFWRRALSFPSRTCLHLTKSQSFAMDILLSLCLRCLSIAAKVTLRLSG